MAGHATAGDDAITGINVTPLVDIVLVLLIIFMVTASYIVKDAIDVDLPRAASGGETVGETLSFAIDKDAKLFLDGHPVDPATARAAVRAAVGRSKDARALIGAYRAVAHGEVVALIDLVKSEGMAKFAIQIVRDDAARAAAGATP